jgi:hypothetical protein
MIREGLMKKTMNMVVLALLVAAMAVPLMEF